MEEAQTGKTIEKSLNEHAPQPNSTSVQKEELRPVEAPQQHSSQKQHLHDFLCQRHGAFDAQMHAWLHCIGDDDEAAEGIRLETGHLPPAVQLAQHCAEQVLKKEMAEKPGFAAEFWRTAQQSCAALPSRLLRAWIEQLMDLALSQVSLHATNTTMIELLETGKALSLQSESASATPRRITAR